MEMVLTGHIGVAPLKTVTVFLLISFTDCETLEKGRSRVKMTGLAKNGKE